jgi:hypothetical protein
LVYVMYVPCIVSIMGRRKDGEQNKGIKTCR